MIGVQIQANSEFTLDTRVKTFVHLIWQKRVGKEHNIVYNTDTVDQPENITLTSSPVLSETFSLHKN